MNYMEIVPMEFNNGKGTGQTLFVSGCPFHCKNCFNPDAWEYHAGEKFTKETLNEFAELALRPMIKRVTILGGEPLCNENVSEVFHIIQELIKRKPTLSIWVYTGYTYEDILSRYKDTNRSSRDLDRFLVLGLINVLVDGQYVDELYDELLPFRGSSNQRIIDCKASMKNFPKLDPVIINIEPRST